MKKREEGYILGQVVIAIALISAILMSATSMYINLNKNTSLEEERIQAMVLAYNKWQEISSASYDKVESEARKVSQLEPFEIETSVGAETTLPSGDKSKTVTVSVFKGSNLNPSFSLPAEKLSSQASGVPKGSIILWSGFISTIPTGFQLCDGTNDTPDLRNRFVVGAGSDSGIGYTPTTTESGTGFFIPGTHGGQGMHQLTIAEMPLHDHTSSGSGGSAIASKGGLYHGPGTFSKFITAPPSDNAPWGDITCATYSASVTTSSNGGGQAHNGMPPYYSLAYIIKL